MYSGFLNFLCYVTVIADDFVNALQIPLKNKTVVV